MKNEIKFDFDFIKRDENNFYFFSTTYGKIKINKDILESIMINKGVMIR